MDLCGNINIRTLFLLPSKTCGGSLSLNSVRTWHLPGNATTDGEADVT